MGHRSTYLRTVRGKDSRRVRFFEWPWFEWVPDDRGGGWLYLFNFVWSRQ